MADFRTLMRGFRDTTVPDDARLASVRDGLRRPRRRPARLVGGGLAVGALAAALAFGIRTPAPAVPVPLPAAGALSADVHVVSSGDGDVVVSGSVHTLAWRRGTLDLDVAPNRGVDLTVTTDEGTVRVVGTSFRVTRDALGTTVSVSRGEVETDCALGGPTRVRAGESRTCLPRTAIGALGRIHAQQDAGAAPEVLLAEIEAASARPDATGVVANELGAARVGALLALDRPADALAAAERALHDAPGSRDAELRRVAARLHVGAGDCAAALPHLTALAASDDLGPDAVLLTRCSREAP